MLRRRWPGIPVGAGSRNATDRAAAGSRTWCVALDPCAEGGIGAIAHGHEAVPKPVVPAGIVTTLKAPRSCARPHAPRSSPAASEAKPPSVFRSSLRALRPLALCSTPFAPRSAPSALRPAASEAKPPTPGTALSARLSWMPSKARDPDGVRGGAPKGRGARGRRERPAERGATIILQLLL